MGKPVPGYDVEIMTADGTRAPDGEVGDIAVRADPRPVGLFGGYHRDPDATAARFRDGWYYTGDRATRDADGYLWFEGRDDDIITSSAYRIGPFEVESALIEHPAVMETGVVGKADPQRTEIVCAFVILADGHAPTPELATESQDHTKNLTAPYKYPLDPLRQRLAKDGQRQDPPHRGARLDARGDSRGRRADVDGGPGGVSAGATPSAARARCRSSRASSLRGWLSVTRGHQLSRLPEAGGELAGSPIDAQRQRSRARTRSGRRSRRRPDGRSPGCCCPSPGRSC